jgi:hypothetical protein
VVVVIGWDERAGDKSPGPLRGKDYNPGLYRTAMPKGLKQTSSSLAIGFNAAETAANTFTQSTVDLNLDPLNREVFVVQAINLDAYTPDVVAGTSTSVAASLTSTSQTDVSDLSNANCLAKANNLIKMAAGSVEGVPFVEGFAETPTAIGLEYIGIIATNDFFIQVKGTGNTAAKQVNGKLYGYRAIATADIYAALVQSEVLSA